MKTVKVLKTHPKAQLPQRANPSDAGFDLVATEVQYKDGYLQYHTGLSLEIPEGYAGFLYPRSSISNYDLTLANCVGVIDSGYRGEILARFRVLPPGRMEYKVGDRIAQLIIRKVEDIAFEEAIEGLEESDRGTSGFGSSGQ